MAPVLVTVNVMFCVPLLPSVTDTLLMLRLTVSLSTMVPVACASAMVALDGELRFTTNDSVGSFVVSPATGTRMVCAVVPALNVTVPDRVE